MEVGQVLEGRVTGITKFGAFVALPEGRSGLVHISEVANAFVSEISEYLSVGQTVRVRIMSMMPDGKINLSIKRAEEAPRPSAAPSERQGYRRPAAPRAEAQPRPAAPRAEAQPRPAEAPQGVVAPPSADSDFEDKLRSFMRESDSRIADNRLYAERPRRNNRRGK